MKDKRWSAVYHAVCSHCVPRGCYGNLFRFAKYFADSVMQEITDDVDCYEIPWFYTKDHCPYVVYFR